MLDDPNKVWPTGLTWPEAQELHKHVIDGDNVIIMQWALANFRDLDYHWISPIVFAAGDTMSLITTGCSASCAPGMYYAGYLANS